MGEKILRILIVSLFLICLIGFGSAEYTLGSPSYTIETSYEPGQGVDGWISIKFTDESNSTLFEDSEENFMTLIEIINENPLFEYTVTAEGTIETTDFQNLILDGDVFKVPSTPGNITYQFNFSGEEIFTEEIEIALSTDDLETAINTKTTALNNLKEKINAYDSFEQTSINSALEISEIEAELADISLEYLSAETQEELNNISSRLSLIKIPYDVSVSSMAEFIPIFPATENVNLNAVEIATGSTYESNSTTQYKNAIIGWNVNNLDTEISFKGFSAYYSTTPEVLVNIFNLKTTKKNAINYSVYIFLEKRNNTLFKESYQEQEQGNYYAFEFTENTKTISFSTTEDVEFASLPFFISPAMTELGLEDFEYEEGEINEKEKEEKKKLTIFILSIIFVLILGFIFYLVLQTWYKKRYENYLFKNKNDLYNLAVYITNAKKRGLDNGQIQENLRKSRWSLEQIRYALRKYSGKRTGMYEIPLKKALEKKGYSKDGYRGYPLK